MGMSEAVRDGIKCSAFILTYVYENAHDEELREEAWNEIVRRLNAYEVLINAASAAESGVDIATKWYR